MELPTKCYIWVFYLKNGSFPYFRADFRKFGYISTSTVRVL